LNWISKKIKKRSEKKVALPRSCPGLVKTVATTALAKSV
jgi:hypothetical protein